MNKEKVMDLHDLGAVLVYLFFVPLGAACLLAALLAIRKELE